MQPVLRAAYMLWLTDGGAEVGMFERARARYSGLRLLDGTLVLKVSRGRETEQIGVNDGAAFDPALSGLEVRMRSGAHARAHPADRGQGASEAEAPVPARALRTFLEQ